MNGGTELNVISLVLASSLVMVSLLISATQKLGLGKETFISVIRAVVQLIIVGYLLEYIFGLENPLFTTGLLIVMIFNAAYNAAKRGGCLKNRGGCLKNGLLVSFIAIGTGAILTLTVLVTSKAIKYEPNQVIPVGGMIISNAMVALGLCYRQLTANFNIRREEVETKLSLGADILPSSLSIIRDAIRTGMVPTIDSAKTLGIVSLPGMMTGLILGGVSPLIAIRFQIMVTFMMLSTTSISSVIACYLYYRNFFNDRKQLVV